MIRRLAVSAGVVALIAAGIVISRPFDRNSAPAPTPSAPVAPNSTIAPTAETATAPSAGLPAGSAPSADVPAAAREARLKTLETGVIESLPSIAEIRKKTNEEVHATPPEILESGRRLGELAEFLTANPDLVRAALPTYVRCAEDASVPTGTRALCTFRLHGYEKDWDEATRASYAKLPPEVRSVAKQLEGTE